MGECCKVSGSQVSSQTRCPGCGEVGRVVADETIRAVLKQSATPLLALERRFCKTRTCKVLYYGADGRFVEKDAAAVRIGVKETEDPIPLCYCFNFSRADVRREVAETGSSSIPARIAAEVKAGRCACEAKNPSGGCCLAEVSQAVKHARKATSESVFQSVTRTILAICLVCSSAGVTFTAM